MSTVVHTGAMPIETTSPTPPAHASIARPVPRLALVGDRLESVRAHPRISALLPHLGGVASERFDAYWLHSSTLEDDTDLSGFDGIWAVPGSPYANDEGVLSAIRTARTHQIPYLGTCAGSQHLLLEFARNVCGLANAEHGEMNPVGETLLLVPLECSLLGVEDAVTVTPGTRAASIMGAGMTTERFFCRFGMNRDYAQILQAHGLVISAVDAAGDMRIVELPGHPFFLGTLFQPELSSDETWIHPIITAFADAVVEHANARNPIGGHPESAIAEST